MYTMLSRSVRNSILSSKENPTALQFYKLYLNYIQIKGSDLICKLKLIACSQQISVQEPFLATTNLSFHSSWDGGRICQLDSETLQKKNLTALVGNGLRHRFFEPALRFEY